MEKPASQFQNIANRILRHILEQEPQHVSTAAVRQALSFTLDALGRDVIDPSLPASALEQRVDAATAASNALMRRPVQKAKALRALQQFWIR